MDGNSSKPRDRGSFSSGELGTARLISIEQLRHLVRLLDRSDVTVPKKEFVWYCARSKLQRIAPSKLLPHPP